MFATSTVMLRTRTRQFAKQGRTCFAIFIFCSIAASRCAECASICSRTLSTPSRALRAPNMRSSTSVMRACTRSRTAQVSRTTSVINKQQQSRGAEVADALCVATY